MGKNGHSVASPTGKAVSKPAAAPSSSPPQPAMNDILADSDGSKIVEVLRSVGCDSVLSRLQAQGYSEHVAQRACLELHHAKREVSQEAAMEPLQPLELLKFLSDIVALMVDRLKPGAAQLQSPPASGAGAAPEAALHDVAAVVQGQCAALSTLLDPRWQAVLAAHDACGEQGAASPDAVDAETLLQGLQLGKAPAAPHGQPRPPAWGSEPDGCSTAPGPAPDVPAARASSPPASGGAAGASGSPADGAADPGTRRAVGLHQQVMRALERMGNDRMAAILGAAAGEAAASASGQAGALAASAQAGEAAPGLTRQQLERAAHPSGEAPPPSLPSILGLGGGDAVVSLEARDSQAMGAHPASQAAAADAVGAAQAAQEPQSVAAELASLRQHRDWADRRIAQLIKRVSDAERPVREEAARLMREVQALRAEKEGMKGRLQELERSIGKVKEASHAEAATKRALQQVAREAAAELKAASLRDAEAAAEARALRKQLATERKLREAAEARCRRSTSDAASSAAAAAAAAQDEVAALRRQLREQQLLAEKRRRALDSAEATANEVLARAHAAAGSAQERCEALEAEKAALAAQLEGAARLVERSGAEAAQERRALLEQLEAAQRRAGKLEAAMQHLQELTAAARADASAAAQRAADADARAAAASAAADSAQQQLAALRQLQQQQQQGQGQEQAHLPALHRPDLPVAPPTQPRSEGYAPGGLFGGGSLWGGGLFGGSLLDAPPVSPSPVPPRPRSASLGSSSPLSQSGAATPHSMHGNSIANSPGAPPPGHPHASFLGGGSMFAQLLHPQPALGTHPAPDAGLRWA